MHVCRELVTKSADVNGLLNKSGNIKQNSGILCEKFQFFYLFTSLVTLLEKGGKKQIKLC